MFRLFISIDEGIMQQVCNESVSSRCLMPKDDLFISGTHALDAFFLDEGKLNYLQDPDTSPVEELSSRRVVPGSAMIAEAALWSQWIHVGTAESLVCSKVHTIHADNLVNALQPHAHLMKIAAEYAQQFHKRVVSAKPPHVPWPNDLEVPYTDYCNLVVSMSQGVQVTIGMDAWWHFAEAHHHLLMGGFGSAISRTVSSEARAADKLRQEIESGRSLVVVTGSGSIIRVASIVLLKVTNEEGKILAQVGSTSQDESNDLWKQVKAECQLPGAKQDRDELVSDTITRICRTRLDKDPETLMIREVLSETTESQSKGYGVQTRYLRQIARAEIHSNNLVPGMSVTRSSVTSMELKDAFNSSTSMDKSASRRFSKHSGGSSSSTATYGFMDTDIFVVEYQDRRFLYAWMEQEDFDFLQKPGAENLLRAWIGEVASNDWQPAAPGSHMGSYPLDDSLGPSTMFATAPAADQMGEMAPAMSSSAADAT
uniref:Uncharacterized protein n=1 Tax=Zooxanthella nutricula TaxID=1333877 RepID=A0A7S2LZ44_9DINO